MRNPGIAWCIALTLGIAVLPAFGQSITPNDDTSARPGQGNMDEFLGNFVKDYPAAASYIEFALDSDEASGATLYLYNYWTYNSPNQDIQIRHWTDVRPWEEPLRRVETLEGNPLHGNRIQHLSNPRKHRPKKRPSSERGSG